MGSASSGTPGTLNYGIRLKNNTGVVITSIDISYTGEQWRYGGSSTTQFPDKLQFAYQIVATGDSPTRRWDAGQYRYRAA